MKVLIAVGRLPNGSSVTKRTGEKQYTVRREIRIWEVDGTAKVIKADESARFLVTAGGEINTMGAGVEVIWHATLEEVVALEEE